MGKKKKRNEFMTDNSEEAKEMKRLNQEGLFMQREIKRNRKLKKIRVFNEDTSAVKATKAKKESKSSFESDLANVSGKAVKKFRHVANQKKNEDRRLSKKQGGGKGRINLHFNLEINISEAFKK